MKRDALPSAGAVPLPRPNYFLRNRPRRRMKRGRESWLEELSLDGVEGGDRLVPRRKLGRAGNPLLGPGGTARIPVRRAELEPSTSPFPLPPDLPVPLRERCATTLRRRSANLNPDDRFPRRTAQTPTLHGGLRNAV